MAQSVFGLVIANSVAPSTWPWKGNLVTVKKTKKYTDAEGVEVDNEEKPVELYKEIIESASHEQQWVLDLCCGTGR